MLVGLDQVVITWSSVSGRTYRVQSNTDISTSNWLDLAGDVVATGSFTSRTNDLAGATQVYYRVLRLPSP
jgi:hypothetical protein